MSIDTIAATDIAENATPSSWTILKRGVQALHATPLAILFPFVLFAPIIMSNHMTAVMIMLDEREAATGVVVPGLRMLEEVRRLANFFTLPALFAAWVFGWPWIAGGAAGRMLDHLGSSTLPRSFAAHAKRLYGRAFAVALLFLPPFVAIISLQNVPRAFISTANMPITLALSLSVESLNCSVMMLMWLAVAAIAWEERGVIQAIKKSFSFVGQHPKSTMCLLGSIFVVEAMSMPPLHAFQGFVLQQRSSLTYTFVILMSTAWTMYAIVLSLAWSVAFYHARRPEHMPP